MTSFPQKQVDLKSITYKDKNVRGGQLCFMGTRLPVKMIRDDLRLGWTPTDIHEWSPNLPLEYILYLEREEKEAKKVSKEDHH